MNSKISKRKVKSNLLKLTKHGVKKPINCPKNKLNKTNYSNRKFGTQITNDSCSLEKCIDTTVNQNDRNSQHTETKHYLIDIITHIIELDKAYHASSLLSINESSTEITLNMRTILIKWLIQVGQQFRARSQTLHICVQLIDFVLITNCSFISKENYQLLGIASLFVASKYNQVFIPEASKYLNVCGGLYTLIQLLQMQALILKFTNFNLQIPTITQFTHTLAQQINLPQSSIALMKKISNLCILDFDMFNKYKKMHLAAIVIFFVSKLIGYETQKTKTLFQFIEIDSFKECLRSITKLYKESTKIVQQ